ncbi:Nicotinamidase [Purpureocillium lavendulum]|uniref:Nicotinamidase n=1 Tax=Purpureocillium lavendulum TaxID=1247861 RepID=A0AB34FUN8_9HYPO|nr:Nicotinamidase [Purpureocillium lavendulum]
MLNKTCQTCFRAKIRCVKSQDSGRCDRCLRLEKPCNFAPRDAPGERPAAVPVAGPHSECPFARSLVSRSQASELVDAFRTKLAPHFPFVVVPSSLNETRPMLHLAVLSAASFGDSSLQRRLGALFNQIVGARVANGPVATLDMLQGLLVHLAWAHYQPRPRRHSQHLHLALSIIADLRMDRPRNPLLWMVEADCRRDRAWSPDEVRAVAGAYYLASSSSMLLQKSRSFAFAPYIAESCRRLAAQSLEDSDRYLPAIIEAQRIAECVDSLVDDPAATRAAALEALNNDFAALKSSLAFPLSKSPPLLVLMSMLALLSQSVGSGPFSLAEIRDSNVLAPWLTERMHAVKLIINILVTMPAGDEYGVSNIEWITMYCALSLAARLDVVAADPSVDATHARRALDMPHSLGQVILRLESASNGIPGDDCDAFSQLAQRAKRLEAWYLARLERERPAPSSTGPTDASPLDWISELLPGEAGVQPAAWAGDDATSGLGHLGLYSSWGGPT